jgi:hypothetical protein
MNCAFVCITRVLSYYVCCTYLVSSVKHCAAFIWIFILEQTDKLSWNRSSERPVKSDRERMGSGILEKDGRSY